MAVNRYDKAAEAQFINTYAPIDFGALYQIGAANNAAVERAQKELGAHLAKWSEFKSPSAVDTQKYYDLTVGHLKDTIQKAAENPDFLKTAAGRAELQGMINSVDYASLGQLKQSADNLRAGLEMRAKMEAEGLYNENWDDSNIAQYDTLGTGKVFTDITPVKYMTANELSNPYFDNLKRGDIGSVWQDGVKYRQIGNTKEDLEEIYDTYGNDMINSAQGRKYVQDFMRQGMNREEATAAFREMIIGSQMDRTLRPELKVDPGWEMQMRASIASGRRSGSGNKNEVAAGVTRQDRMMFDVGQKFEKVAKELPPQYQQKLQVGALGLQGHLDALQQADVMYQQNPTQENLVRRQQLEDQYIQAEKNLRTSTYGDILKHEFKIAAKFDLTPDPTKNKSYSRNGYNRGVKRALDAVSTTTALTSIKDGGDRMLTMIGGNPVTRSTSDGVSVQMYEFGDSSGFVLPEMLFANATGTSQPKAKRNAGAFADDSFPFEQFMLDGSFTNVNFIPANENNLIEQGDSMYIKGKVQIPVDQIESALGTGIGFYTGTGAGVMLAPGTFGTGIHALAPFTRGTTKGALKKNYGLREVEYGDDETPYYEVEVYKKLPNNDVMSYWQPINVLRENTPSSGGIGSASMAQDISGPSLESILNYSQQ